MERTTITIFKLIKLINKNKAPKKIKWRDQVGKFEEISKDYQFENGLMFISNLREITLLLNAEVEILPDEPEENDMWKDIGEIDNSNDDTLLTIECCITPERAQDWNFNLLKNKINQLIKNQKYLKEKLESKDE